MLDLLLAALAGAGAGFINAVVGSGTLISFPLLLAIGLPPVSANVTNNIGLVPGSFAGAYGYRRELRGQRRRVAWLVPASLAGGITGALLLLVLPPEVFSTVVPVLIGVALVMVLVQPRVQSALRRRRQRIATQRGVEHAVHDRFAAAVPVTAFTGVYGGYFGAAQGVLLLGSLGVVLDEDLQRLNALKNVLTGVVNLVAAVVFVVVAPGEIVWAVTGAVAVGALLGGLLGGRVGRRLPATVLRAVIVVVGVVAIVALLR
ncbi:sulfite exporter TauE/SafE family protein [Aquipuribacter sp. SD81]|uniref:sulfite exporter TauE/SafE family protein n=1 Tax=Aquipuribacter sp. SD81 TaxID=3127703 RepID=UPI0030179900